MSKEEKLRIALEEVMLWIHNWSPVFTEDDEWNDTLDLVQEALREN